MGSIQVLNVGAGDIRITLDKTNPTEVIRAKRIVKDMLRRGYALLVEIERNGEKKYERAVDFDENTESYIIADFDPVEAERADNEETNGEAAANENTAANAGPGAGEISPKKGRKGGRRSVSMHSAKAVGVGRSAGG